MSNFSLFQRARERLHYGADWSQVDALAEAFWYMLVRERGPQKGMGIPIREVMGRDGKKDDHLGQLNARAVDMLRSRHPEITVTKHKDDIFIAFTDDLSTLDCSPDWKTVKTALLVHEGDDLVLKTEANRALPPGDGKHMRERFPGANDGLEPGMASPAQYQEWVEKKKQWEQDDIEEAARNALEANREEEALRALGMGIPLKQTIYSGDGAVLAGHDASMPEAIKAPVRSLRERVAARLGFKKKIQVGAGS
jgi:hypothetical protein